MRTRRFAVGLSLVAGYAVLMTATAWAEEYRGTLAQQMACTPDVMRLCGSAIPDVTRIVACLRQNETQLGNSCRAVFESNAEATPSDLTTRPQTSPGAAGPNAR